MQPAELAVALRRRSPWEATDLGLAMLQRWWRPVYAAHALVMLPAAALALALGWALDAMWAAMLFIWWLEPLYDRAVLHVLSRAVFGEAPGAGSVVRSWSEWSAGALAALTVERADLARSFHLPVRQLEGQRGREARERRRLLARRARGHAVWLTLVWIHFEAALLWSAGALTGLVLPAQLERTAGGDGALAGTLFGILERASATDVLAFAAVILFLEPFYVAAGFGLYLNRRTLLEGWDIEVALRRIAERHALALVLVAVPLALLLSPPAAAQQKNPKDEIAQVLKAPEFGHYRDVLRWQARDRQPDAASMPELTTWHALGHALARAVEVLLWGAAIAALAYALWWLARRLPVGAHAAPEPYRPPALVFGMTPAPETLPPDVPEAAAALARQGRPREALSLLYRGALFELVQKRGVKLLESHTEGEAVRLAGLPYFGALVDAWRQCAYENRTPAAEDIEALSKAYRAAFA